MTRPQSRQTGFTLLEMLVALTLISVIAGSLYASLNAAFKARESANAAVRPARTVSLVLELLRRDLESALPPTGILAGAFIGENATDSALGADADTLEWHAAVGDPAENTSDIAKIELAVTSGANSSGMVLVRRVTRNLLASKTPEPDEEVLCRAVRSFNITYFDGSTWTDAWDASENDNTLPVAIEITLSIDPTAGSANETRDDAFIDEEDAYKLSRVFVLPCSAPATEAGTRIIRDTGN